MGEKAICHPLVCPPPVYRSWAIPGPMLVLFPQIATVAGAVPGQNQEQGTPSVSPEVVAMTQIIET